MLRTQIFMSVVSSSPRNSSPFGLLAKRHMRVLHLLNVTRTDVIQGESKLFFFPLSMGSPPSERLAKKNEIQMSHLHVSEFKVTACSCTS